MSRQICSRRAVVWNVVIVLAAVVTHVEMQLQLEVQKLLQVPPVLVVVVNVQEQKRVMSS
jgi:hypothetical protein